MVCQLYTKGLSEKTTVTGVSSDNFSGWPDFKGYVTYGRLCKSLGMKSSSLNK